MKWLIRFALLLFPTIAWAQSSTYVLPPPCNTGTVSYSGTVTNSSALLIPAPPANLVRTGLFVELLTASSTLALNPSGGTASTTAAGNIVITTGASAPQNIAYINFASLGFIPQSAMNAIAGGSVTVTVLACPG